MTKEITTLAGEISAVVFVGLIGLGSVIWLVSAYHAVKTFRGIKPGKRLIAQINPAGIFMSKYYTDEGNIHRKLALKYGGYFLIVWLCASCAWFIGYVYG